MTATVRRLARNLAVDISTDDVTYLNLPGRTDSNPDISPNSVDSSDFDNGGYASAEITQQSGTVTVSYNSLISGGTPNPAQEMVEACVGEFGDAARLYVRWYDTDGGTRGFKARAIVKVAYSSTGVTDLRKVTVTFTTDGEITKLAAADITAAIDNADKPVITAASQTGNGVGSLITITGQHFNGTTAVKFGATAATSYTVVSDSTIVATAPATGASAITVTNAAGVSSGFNFTVAA